MKKERILNTITQIEESCEKLTIKNIKFELQMTLVQIILEKLLRMKLKNKSYLKYYKNEKKFRFWGCG